MECHRYMNSERWIKYSLHFIFLSLILGYSGYQVVQLQPKEGSITFVTKEPTDSMPKTHFTLLHIANFVYAAENGNIETVKKYIELGVNVNSQDHNMDTALMGASLNGHKEIVELLLKNKADPSIKNREGYDSFDFSAMHNRKSLTAQLLEGQAQLRQLSSLKNK